MSNVITPLVSGVASAHQFAAVRVYPCATRPRSNSHVPRLQSSFNDNPQTPRFCPKPLSAQLSCRASLLSAMPSLLSPPAHMLASVLRHILWPTPPPPRHISRLKNVPKNDNFDMSLLSTPLHAALEVRYFAHTFSVRCCTRTPICSPIALRKRLLPWAAKNSNFRPTEKFRFLLTAPLSTALYRHFFGRHVYVAAAYMPPGVRQI